MNVEDSEGEAGGGSKSGERAHIEVNRHERGTLFKKPVNRGY